MSPQVHSLNDLVRNIGEVGLQMTEIGVVEGSAGNISVFVRELDGVDWRFRSWGLLPLPVPVPDLADGWVIVSGTGKRLRDIARSPETTLCLLHIHQDGKHAHLHAAVDMRPTIELNSHLAIHNDHVRRRQLNHHAILHTQPRYLTYLSHHPDYDTTEKLSKRLLRWEPETIAQFPEGIATIPFEIPGSRQLMETTLKSLQTYRMVVWQKHGTVSRADDDIHSTGDLVEYAEGAARYEYLNLQAGEPNCGLTDEELRRLSKHHGIKQKLF